MKIKNIFILVSVLATVLAGCVAEDRPTVDEIQIGKSFIGISPDGGTEKTTLSVKGDWEIVGLPEDGSWLTVSPLRGEAGKDIELTFSAGAYADGARELGLSILCMDKERMITVRQSPGIVKPVVYTIEEVLGFTDADNGKIIAVKGVIARITGPQYGELYLKDDKGNELLIYNCQPSFGEINPAVGDIITVEGPFTIYKGTYELNKGSKIIDIERSLIQISTPEMEIEKDGGEIIVETVVKGEGLMVSIEYEGEEGWLTYMGTKKNGESTMIVFNALPYNEKKGPRKATVTLSTLKGDAVSEGQLSLTQYGITPEAISVTEALTKTKGDWISVTGVVTGLNNKGFILTDKDGVSIQGYPNATPTVKIGDEILLTGKYGIYNKCAQIETPVIRAISDKNEVVYPATKKVTEDLIKALDGKSVNSAEYVELTGVPSGQYGDILVEGTDGYGISPYQVLKSFNYPAGFDGKTVTIKGYVLQVYKGKTLRVNVVSIEEVK